MRNIATLFVVAVALNCWTAGAWAQPVASNFAAPKAKGVLNVMGYNANDRQTLPAGLKKSETLSNDMKTKPGSGGMVRSTDSVLPESVPMSAHVDVAFKIANLQQTKAPGQVSSSEYLASHPLSVKTELNRR